tara:strand:+ start:489 stop:773 length:285 start_codon:yes stop_codon:yes gene_type:complete
MPERRTPFELSYPHLAQVFDYWTFEADAEIHTTAGVLEGLILLIRSFEDGDDQVPINTLMSLIEAAETQAKEAKPYLDNWAAETTRGSMEGVNQ